jgi:hypothetical protein
VCVCVCVCVSGAGEGESRKVSGHLFFFFPFFFGGRAVLRFELDLTLALYHLSHTLVLLVYFLDKVLHFCLTGLNLALNLLPLPPK